MKICIHMQKQIRGTSFLWVFLDFLPLNWQNLNISALMGKKLFSSCGPLSGLTGKYDFIFWMHTTLDKLISNFPSLSTHPFPPSPKTCPPFYAPIISIYNVFKKQNFD